MSIWTDEVLNQYAADAEIAIQLDLKCIFHRFHLETTADLSVYTLPEKVRGVTRITWRGEKLDEVDWNQLVLLTPSSVFVDGSTKIEGTSSRPYYYALHPTNVHDLRFFPTPNESFTTTGDPYSPAVEGKCIVSCWRNIDTSDPLASLPTYIDRRTRKAYILWKAFEKEGKGQNLTAAKFYKSKYTFLISQFRSINEGAYVSRRYALGNTISFGNSRPLKPTLPSNFERPNY